MTRAEFDAWIEENYEKLRAFSRARFRQYGDDALQSAIARVIASGHYERYDRTRNAVAFFFMVVRSEASNRRRAAFRAGRTLASYRSYIRAGRGEATWRVTGRGTKGRGQGCPS